MFEHQNMNEQTTYIREKRKVLEWQLQCCCFNDSCIVRLVIWGQGSCEWTLRFSIVGEDSLGGSPPLIQKNSCSYNVPSLFYAKNNGFAISMQFFTILAKMLPPLGDRIRKGRVDSFLRHLVKRRYLDVLGFRNCHKQKHVGNEVSRTETILFHPPQK